MKPIKEIKKILDTITNLEDERVIEIRRDERKGVMQALKACEKRIEKANQRKEKFEQMQTFERLYRNQGFRVICGIDEVGRGPLAGPVVAAAVILPENIQDLGFDDSKKLSKSAREEIFKRIQQEALAIGIGIIDAEEIDRVNIYQATKLAMIQAVSNLSIQPDCLLIDAMQLDLSIPQENIIKGDARSISIAAASIIAKQTRDQMMEEYAQVYPNYGFEHNAGYGTKQHLGGLNQFGPTPIHRKTFAPVSSFFK